MLTNEQVIQLKLAHKQTREKRLADRIKAVLYVHYGLSYSEIAKLLLFDEVTIRRYCKQFQEKGVEGLLEYRYSGGQSRLTVTQETEIKEYFRENTPRTAIEVVAHVWKKYDVSYLVIGVTKLLYDWAFPTRNQRLSPVRLTESSRKRS